MAETSERSERWHQSIVAFVSVISLVIGQTVVVSIWLANVRSDVDTAKQVNAQQDSEIETLRGDGQRMRENAATITAQYQSLKEGLTELKQAQRETNELLRQYLQGKQP